jgi:hypothetical protein
MLIYGVASGESGHQSRQRNPCIAGNNTMSILSQNNDAANSQIYPDPPDNGNSSQFGSEYLDSTTQDSAYFSRLSSANDHQPLNRNTKRNTTHAGNRSSFCRRDRVGEIQNRTAKRRTIGYRAFSCEGETRYNSQRWHLSTWWYVLRIYYYF